MDGSKRQVSKRTKGLGQFWSEKRCHLSHSDLPFEDAERPSFIQFRAGKGEAGHTWITKFQTPTSSEAVTRGY